MNIKHIDHINIAAPEALLDKVLHFYVSILGLKVGNRPDFSRPGYWLYAADKPVVHLIENAEKQPCENSCLDHFAFRATGLNATKAWLEANNVKYRQAKVEALQQTQLFLTDPAGNGVELSFLAEPEQI
ncbi:VOC family protein [Lacimicrobium alkaliphilum]|uniref:Diguanylate cyclase n=1 Tax=Lacimicrobium alkaliphilum TaxID=1526571 RepID=A0ABQ1RTY8_9ALTE|nr:VOC family protein [Lacimicrobium alkaliphilum]GGD78745.1 diguanylate cyclase [Lacimicrobium alkaliphilum]